MYRKSIMRIGALVLLVAAGMVLIFCKDIEADHITLLCVVNLIVKVLGAGCIGASWSLYRRWMHKDPWISKYERWIREAEESEL